MRPFFRKFGVDPRAEPGLVLAPAQALLEQDLVDPAAPHRDALPLAQVCGEPVERPRRKRQIQAARAGQRGADHGRNLLGRVGRRTTGAVAVFKGRKTFGIEAADAAAHRLGIEPKRRGDGGRRLASARSPDDAGALDPSRRCRPRAGQGLHRRGLFGRQLAQANRQASHGKSPAQKKLPSYRTTCRMNHLGIPSLRPRKPAGAAAGRA
jgi:hypothetical protein